MARKEEEFNIAMDIKEEELRQLKEQLVTQRMSTAFEESTLKGSKYEWALALKSKGMPCIKKEKDPASMLSMVSAAICAVMAVIMSKTRNVTRLKVVCKVLFEMFLFGYDETRFVFHQMARKFVREEIYKPWKILKAMDMSPKGSLNYRGIETLRHVECLQKYERGFLPSSSSVQEKAQRMYEVGQELCPIKQETSPLGEMFSFEYERTVRLILKTFGLHEIAQMTSVEICITLDGAELCDHLNHLTAGVKLVDKRAIDPKTKRPLFTFSEELLGSAFSCQSRNFCFILKSLIGRDTKDAYDAFSDFFKFFEMVRDIGIPASEHGPQLQPMIVLSSQDMSSLWKCLKTGTGARKNCNSYFCHVCPCNSSDILFFTEGENRCDRCKAKGKEKCYHWHVGDKASIDKFQEMLESVHNIDYVANGGSDDNIEELFFFSSLLTEELKLRNMPITGSLEERREALRNQLVFEEKLHLLKLAVERSEHGKAAALMLIEQAIPCIMHLENRVGEKILTMLLSTGAKLYQERRSAGNIAEYIAQVERIVSTRILGTQWRPKQWRVPIKENCQEIASVSLSNTKTRQLMTCLEPLIDYIFQHPDDATARQDWLELLDYYNPAIELLRKPTEFSDEEIEEFQTLVDSFYEKWIKLVGSEGITNYVHMLGSGHIRYYLILHRNLYKFSQQNWESLNEKMKTTYFRNTQRGGNYGKNTVENERYYLLSILKVFQRELLWLSGIGDELFKDD